MYIYIIYTLVIHWYQPCALSGAVWNHFGKARTPQKLLIAESTSQKGDDLLVRVAVCSYDFAVWALYERTFHARHFFNLEDGRKLVWLSDMCCFPWHCERQLRWGSGHAGWLAISSWCYASCFVMVCLAKSTASVTASVNADGHSTFVEWFIAEA